MQKRGSALKANSSSPNLLKGNANHEDENEDHDEDHDHVDVDC